MRTAVLDLCRERTLARRSWHRVLLGQPAPARSSAVAPPSPPSRTAPVTARRTASPAPRSSG